MSKLSFRARALDASKPMPIYMAEELPDLPDYSAINRAVPQMPSGMEKEEECEHHLQRAICAGLIIPTPEVSEIPNRDFYEKVYPGNYKQPRQLIHMQPFTMEQDIPDYDMDSEDERWLQSQTQKLELSPLKFEEMMDRLEKSSGQTVVTLNEAKILLKEDDDLIIAVFDYWLNKRLKTQHPLILTVKTEQRTGQAANNPYLAFRRRTEKMQTRKNRKNDETSYEKMLKLRRDLYRAVQLLELIKKREKVKREYVNMTIEIFDKRYLMKDYNGAIYAEATTAILNNSNRQTLMGQSMMGIGGGITRPAFTPIFHNHYTNQNWNKSIMKDELLQRKEKRQYKKRKHKSFGGHLNRTIDSYCVGGGGGSSDDDLTQSQLSPESDDIMEDEGQFAFRRNKFCSYHMPLPKEGNWPWCPLDENGLGDKRFRFTLTSLSNPKRCIGFARRRIGRGGRIILDRYSTNNDDYWRTLDFSIYESANNTTTDNLIVNNKIDDCVLNANNNLKTNYKNDLSSNFNNSVNNNNNNNIVRTNLVSDFNNKSESDVKIEIKKEIIDNSDIIDNNMKIDECNNDTDDMVEFLRSLRRDWLHFRPKTPPTDYEATNDMLLQSDNFLSSSICANNSTPSCFSMEIQSLDTDSNTLLLDTSTFLTDPFLFEQNFDNLIDVPITDTRQQQQQQQQSSSTNDKVIQINNNNNTLNNINNDSKKLIDETCNDDDDDDDNRIVGCSKFFLTDINSNTNNSNNNNNNGNGNVGCEEEKKMIKEKNFTYTLTSPKFNNYFISDNKIHKSNNNNNNNNNDSAINNTNGLLPQFGLDGVNSSGRTKNNKLYAYNTSVMGYSNNNASSGTLSLHTSAHTLTLNSHSANLLEIPIANDAEAVTTKLVTTGGESGTPTTNNNNKTKTIVRKNNLVMEVT